MKLKVKNLIFLIKTLWQDLRKSKKNKTKVIRFDKSWKTLWHDGMQNHGNMFYSFTFADS